MTDRPASFAASYADWKLIKTRAVIQIVFEVPIESHDAAYQALGGMPVHAQERWFAIARLDQSKFEQRKERRDEDTQQGTTATAPGAAPRERRSLSDVPLSQRAGMLCNAPAFWAFLKEHQPESCRVLELADGTDGEKAAIVLRSLCGVQSRSELSEDNQAGQEFLNIESGYNFWMRFS